MLAPATRIFIAICFISNTLFAQVFISSFSLQSFNITPEAFLNAALLNNGGQVQAEMTATLYNANGEMLLAVKSVPFPLKAGINPGLDNSRKVAQVQYGGSTQAAYIRNARALPAGKFKVCVQLYALQIEASDEYCDEIESELSQFLFLVDPADKDTVEQKYPLLVWNHSEPFSVVSQGDFYRMIVCEMAENQSAEQAITTNPPLMIRNYLNTHALMYPFDARELAGGNRYAWQVQKMSDGAVVNKSEAWEFVLRTKMEQPHSYVSIKKEIDASPYLPVDNKVFFRFDERYNAGISECKIYDEKRTPIELKAQNQSGLSKDTYFKSIGYNQFEIDLNELAINRGLHYLEIKNEKGEVFRLKFMVD